MEVGDGLVVFGHSGPVGVFRQGQAALGIQNHADRFDDGPAPSQQNRFPALQIPAGGNQAVGIVLHQVIVGIDIAISLGQAGRHVQLHVLQEGLVTR